MLFLNPTSEETRANEPKSPTPGLTLDGSSRLLDGS